MALLFGLMVTASYLHSEGMYDYLELMFTYKARNYFDVLARVVFLCGILAAFITNDAVCIFITPLVVKISLKFDLPRGPFLIALGTSANIGSAATITGNPQNALIALKGNIAYMDFAKYMMPIAFVGLAINYGFLCLVYWPLLRGRHIVNGVVFTTHGSRDLGLDALAHPHERLPDHDHDHDHDHDATHGSDIPLATLAASPSPASLSPAPALAPAAEPTTAAVLGAGVAGVSVAAGATSASLVEVQVETASMAAPSVAQVGASPLGSTIGASGRALGADTPIPIASPPAKPSWTKHRWTVRVAHWLTYAGALGIFVAFFAGVNIGLASMAGAMFIVAVQGLLRRVDPHPFLMDVDYNLMLFFAGLFITVEAFNLTGFPAAIENALFGSLDMSQLGGFCVFAVAVLVASNLLSNVPAILLIAPFIYSLPAELQFGYWIAASWLSTVGGNLTIIGYAGVRAETGE